MDFIESWFGVAPDGGDGSLELVYLSIAAAAAALWLLRWRVAGRWTAGRSRARE